MFRDEVLQFFHQALDLFGGGVPVPFGADLREDPHHLPVQCLLLFAGSAFRLPFILPVLRRATPFGFRPAGVFLQFRPVER